MFTTELIFLIMVIFNVIALCFIVRGFFRKEKVSGINSIGAVITKIFSVVLNISVAYVSFWGVICGLLFIAPFGLFGFMNKQMYVSTFAMGLALYEASAFVPYGLNALLYKFWYKKLGLSKWWTFPALIIGAGAFIICILSILTEKRFIRYWSQIEWVWR